MVLGQGVKAAGPAAGASAMWSWVQCTLYFSVPWHNSYQMDAHAVAWIWLVVEYCGDGYACTDG
jgi:hypothetical protein